ncbi:MAG: dipeptidase [bacterium]
MMKLLLKIVLVVVLLLLLAFFFVLPPLADRSANRVAEGELAPPSDSAQALHPELWIADLHADVLLWNRNILKSHDHGHVDVPRLQQGNVALQAFTIVSKTPFGLNFESNSADSDMLTFLVIAQRWPTRTWFNLTERALYQSQKLHEFARDSEGKLSIIKSKEDLSNYMTRRDSEPDITAGFLGIEGAQVLEGQLSNVQALFDAGFRMMAPTHFFDTEVGGSAHGVEKGGLTELGRQMIAEMESLGMIVDLAHASSKTIDDVLAIATKPVFNSHTGVKGTCDNTRNLSDAQLRGIAATGGVIGVAFFPGATCGDDIDSIVRAMQYAVDIVGVEHVGLGSDFDGAVQTPFDAANIIQLTDALLKAGFSGDDIALIMGGNVRRVLMQALPDSDS